MLPIDLQVDSEEERLPDERYVEELAKKLPQGTDKTPEVLEEALKGLPDKYDINMFSICFFFFALTKRHAHVHISRN